MVIGPKKVVRVRREQGLGGFFVGCILIGLALDFYFGSLPIGTLSGIGAGFILLAILKLVNRN